jgi:hypothetical protein
MPVVVVISQHLLNVFVQLANKRGLKKVYSLIAARQRPGKNVTAATNTHVTIELLDASFCMQFFAL